MSRSVMSSAKSPKLAHAVVRIWNTDIAYSFRCPQPIGLYLQSAHTRGVSILSIRCIRAPLQRHLTSIRGITPRHANLHPNRWNSFPVTMSSDDVSPTQADQQTSGKSKAELTGGGERCKISISFTSITTKENRFFASSASGLSSSLSNSTTCNLFLFSSSSSVPGCGFRKEPRIPGLWAAHNRSRSFSQVHSRSPWTWIYCFRRDSGNSPFPFRP